MLNLAVKKFNFTLALMISVGLSSLALGGQSICPLELSNLSRFQDEDSKTIRQVELFDYLTKENNILFSVLHFTATTEALKDNKIDIKKFKKLYSYTTPDQQYQFTENIWKYMLNDINPYRYHSFAPNSDMPPEARQTNDLFDLNKLNMNHIESLNKLAEYWGYSYPEYLKVFQAIQAIEKNPEIRKQTIKMMAASLTETISVAKKVVDNRKSLLEWKKARGGLTYDDYHKIGFSNGVGSFMGGLAATVGGAGLVMSPTHLHDPIALGLLGVGAVAATAPVITYNAVKMPTVLFRKSTSYVQISLLKRKLRKQISQNQLQQDSRDEE